MNRLAKGAVFAVAAVVLVAVLFTWVFPWVDRTFVNDPTLPAPSSTSP